jgi:hypothetical protein
MGYSLNTAGAVIKCKPDIKLLLRITLEYFMDGVDSIIVPVMNLIS